MGLSRSRLFALAVGDFLERQRRDQMLSRLNEVNGERADPPDLPGQLVTDIRAPVTGSAAADRHPWVVVQNDVSNQSAIATAIVCLISSNLIRAKAPGNVFLNFSQILTVNKSELVERIGKLSAAVSD